MLRTHHLLLTELYISHLYLKQAECRITYKGYLNNSPRTYIVHVEQYMRNKHIAKPHKG